MMSIKRFLIVLLFCVLGCITKEICGSAEPFIVGILAAMITKEVD